METPDRPLLPLADQPRGERADAARNRAVLLSAARDLIAREGAAALTMDRLAAEAGVGKGTVFRRFESREGLMAAVLDFSEAAWQGEVLGGPPPLGPGAPPLERLLAFGRSRLETTLVHGELIEAAGRAGGRGSAAHSFVLAHVRHLLGELEVDGDLPLLAAILLAPLEAPVLRQQIGVDRLSVDRVYAAWADVVRRVVGAPAG